jgi:hypothetical protein
MPNIPPLDVPAPPARAIEPIEADAAAPPAKTPDEPPPVAVPVRPRPAPREPRAEAPRVDVPKAEPPPESPKVAEEPPKPPTILQTAPAGAEGEVERTIRVTLARATTDLSRVDYRGLNMDARTQYDTAKRFIQQSDEALRAKNLVFAKNLADKAAALAAQLAGK